jgi:hypothetical protein
MTRLTCDTCSTNQVALETLNRTDVNEPFGLEFASIFGAPRYCTAAVSDDPDIVAALEWVIVKLWTHRHTDIGPSQNSGIACRSASSTSLAAVCAESAASAALASCSSDGIRAARSA